MLLDFAAAAHLDRPDLRAGRQAVLAAVGSAGLVEACLTVGAFNGLTRVADATGIALDGGTLAATRDVRAELGLNDMAGARNTGAVVHASGPPRSPRPSANCSRTRREPASDVAPGSRSSVEKRHLHATKAAPHRRRRHLCHRTSPRRL